jgi:CRP/FNR family transcriptional regulator
MMSDAEHERLLALYPCLAGMRHPLHQALRVATVVKHVPAGAVLFDERQDCGAFPMVLSGGVRVTKSAPNGRELQLYRVQPGESCVITSSCLLGHAAYNARGEAEADTTLAVIPVALFARLVSEHEPFRSYVFRLFSERIADLMQLVEAVAFQRLDQRLAALLLGRAPVLHLTHQQLADELGSVREIVSRLLKGFAEQGLVTLGRERIEVRDAPGLGRIAGAAA